MLRDVTVMPMDCRLHKAMQCFLPATPRQALHHGDRQTISTRRQPSPKYMTQQIKYCCRRYSVVSCADVREFAPWALMGRVKQAGDLFEESTSFKVTLKLQLAGNALQKSPTEILQRYEALLSLLPDFEQRLINLPQPQVTELLTDVNIIAARMIELKRMLPFCDVDAIATSCPRLLLAEDWPTVVAAVAQLRALYSNEDDIAALVQLNPVILHQDVNFVIAELQRLYNYKTPADAARHLRARPDIVFLLEKGLKGVGPATQ
eukprot:jgi/Ulvmu1/11437/UM076_0011.1